jgi:hypothetical protein
VAPAISAYRSSAGSGASCYGSVKMIRFSYSNEDTKDEEPKEVYSEGENGQNP